MSQSAERQLWEIVQRSGHIDIWRFQAYEDIILSFKQMKKKVPPEWVGKDATFSTGCTKEMRIALDVQQKHPEMQIIGPFWPLVLLNPFYIRQVRKNKQIVCPLDPTPDKRLWIYEKMKVDAVLTDNPQKTCKLIRKYD